MVTNYFKTGNQITLFDDTTLSGTAAAYAAALVPPGKLSAWRQPQHNGPWETIGLVGYRKRADILQDIKMAKVTHSSAGEDKILLAGAAELLMFARNELAARDATAGYEASN